VSIRTVVETIFADVAKEQQHALAPLTDSLDLLKSGLDSLCLAIIVARLEVALGCDPFSAGVDDEVDIPVTFGDFVRLYENAAV